MSRTTAHCIDALHRRLARHLRNGQAFQDAGLYTLSLPLPDLCPVPPNVPGLPPPPLHVWARPDLGHYRVSLGEAFRVEAEGEGRFAIVAEAFERLRHTWQQECLDDAEARVGAWCVFAFDPLDPMSGPWEAMPNSLLMVPEVLLELRENRYRLSLSCDTTALASAGRQIDRWTEQTRRLLTALDSPAHRPGEADRLGLYRDLSVPDEAHWGRLVKAAIRDIRSGDIQKVVPARYSRLYADDAIDPAAAFLRLSARHPSCHSVAVALDADRTLIAATPERLTIRQNDAITSDALGGTVQRHADQRQDQKIVERLLADPKSRHEHALIVTHLANTLRHQGFSASVPATPSVMSLVGMHHLWSRVEAPCPPDTRLLDVVAALHPTPAVAGAPAKASLDWLTRHQGFRRGWYAGTLGWLQPDGDGEFVVLLRCALLEGRYAHLYAGSGIVEGSDLHAELMETELKLDAVIRALGHALPTTDAAVAK